MSLYFTAWAKKAKAEAINNLSIKRRVLIDLFSILKNWGNYQLSREEDSLEKL